MGQAKNRGTREQRMQEAIDSGRTHARVHAFINETKQESVLVSTFPCAECGASITPDAEREHILETPVHHGLQFGDCPNCSSSHMVMSASTKADCIALEPAFAEMKRSLSASSAMVSTVLEGKEIAEYDEEITNKFRMRSGSAKAVQNERMQIALRNSDGEIYRAIGVTGMTAFLEVVHHLGDIGLVDELANESGPRHGYDAIFSA